MFSQKNLVRQVPRELPGEGPWCARAIGTAQAAWTPGAATGAPVTWGLHGARPLARPPRPHSAPSRRYPPPAPDVPRGETDVRSLSPAAELPPSATPPGRGAQRGASLACGPFPLLRWLTRRIHVTGPRAPASARTRLWRVCKVDAGTVAQLPSPGRGRASRGEGESPPRCPEAWTPEGPPQTQGGSAACHPPCTTHARWHDCLSGEPNTPPARPRTRGGVCTWGPLRPPGVVDVGPPSTPGSQI